MIKVTAEAPRTPAPGRRKRPYTILFVYTILYYTILYDTILYYAILCLTMLYYTKSTMIYRPAGSGPRRRARPEAGAASILWYTVLHYTILYYFILCYTIIYLLYYTGLVGLAGRLPRRTEPSLTLEASRPDMKAPKGRPGARRVCPLAEPASRKPRADGVWLALDFSISCCFLVWDKCC